MKLKGSPFAWVSFALIVGVMGTALISPLYALYKEAWQLQASDVSLIYVMYMGGALCSLLFLGRLPDTLGFRPVMLNGLTLAFIGTFISMIAWNVPSLNAGRFIVGIASGMITTSATSGLSALSGPGQMRRVAMLTGVLIAFGFGLGPLLGGILGQWAPYPLASTYVPTLILLSLAMYALSRLQLPEGPHDTARRAFHWRDSLPKLTWTERNASMAFLFTCALPFLAFGVFGLYASMSPLFLDQLVPWHGPVVSGTAISVILLASAFVQVLSTRLPTHWCGAVGLIGLALSNAILMWNMRAGSALLFGLGVLLTAIGHGMSMLTGMNMINRIATPGNRSGLLSTYLVIGYIGSMVPMMGIGWIADHWGMTAAVDIFCSLVIALGTVVAALFLRHPQMRFARD